MFNDNNFSTLAELQLLGIVDAGSFELSNIKPSNWTEANIKMGAPRPGPYRYSYTPYCREIIDRLAVDDPAKWVAVMKGLQIGVSAGVIIPGLCYIIKEAPGNTYFTVGAPDLIDKSVDKLDLAIDRSNLRNYIMREIQRKKNQKSGDTNTKKDFAGGFINITTPNNHKEWRDVSLKYGFIDDFEAAKSASKESGSTRKLMEGRFAAYADSHKIFYISTPELKLNSNIEPAYLLGDQRKYLIPCPCCKEYIELRWNVPEGIGCVWKEPMPDGSGIVWEKDEETGGVKKGSVGYVCQKCGGFFTDKNKQELLNAGHWEPTAKPSKEGYYSYHISSLYAPIGMYDWEHYVNNYIECHPEGQPRKEAEYKTFLTTCLGITYEASAEQPSASAIQKNCRDYPIGTIPETLSMKFGNGRIVLLTCAADMNGKEDDARLDWELAGWDEKGTKWSIKHGSIGTFVPRENALKEKDDRAHWTYRFDAPNSVWTEFERIIKAEYVTDTGRKMKVALSGLDCGYFSNNYAYPFLDRINKFPNTYIVGLKGEKADEFLIFEKDMKAFKPAQERPNLYILKVGRVKDRIAEHMQLRWDSGNAESQPFGFMNFPNPANGLYTYGGYFEHFESERRVIEANAEGTGVAACWRKKNSTVQNHFWDVAVYNESIKDIFMDKVAKELKVKEMTWKEFVMVLTGGK